MQQVLDLLFTKSLKGKRTQIACLAWACIQLLAMKGILTPGQVDAANLFLLPYGVNAAIDHGK